MLHTNNVIQNDVKLRLRKTAYAFLCLVQCERHEISSCQVNKPCFSYLPAWQIIWLILAPTTALPTFRNAKLDYLFWIYFLPKDNKRLLQVASCIFIIREMFEAFNITHLLALKTKDNLNKCCLNYDIPCRRIMKNAWAASNDTFISSVLKWACENYDGSPRFTADGLIARLKMKIRDFQAKKPWTNRKCVCFTSKRQINALFVDAKGEIATFFKIRPMWLQTAQQHSHITI